ncbi:hypothetical protein GMB70_04870 [Turicibacter sanguinis]|nr:hypothetical protein [Turicibacter sanguinis]
MNELIERRHKEPLKEYKIFIKNTQSSELLVMFLKAHLYIEVELTNMLTETIIDEKVIRNSTFSQKLDLANSMGMLDEMYGPIKKVNSIRNSYGHDVNFKFDEEIFTDLISTLSKQDKDDFLSEYEIWKPLLYKGDIPEFNYKTQFLLSNIWFGIVSCRLMAKQMLELRLREKELETLEKYVSNS